jgi:hypothetical protein
VKITTREKRFLIFGGTIVGIALVVYLAVAFFPSRAGISRDVENKKQLLMRQRELLSREEIYKGRIEQYRQRMKLDFARLLPGENPSIASAELQKVLKDMADQNGVEIVRRDILSEEKLPDNLIKVKVRIETQCVPDQLVQFLTAVENYDKLLTIDELVITSFKIAKRWDIRPSITVSGFIAAAESKTAEKAAGAP